MAQTLGFSGNGAPRHLVGIWISDKGVSPKPRSSMSRLAIVTPDNDCKTDPGTIEPQGSVVTQ